MNTATHRDVRNTLALRLWALVMALMLSFGVSAQTASSADAASYIATVRNALGHSTGPRVWVGLEREIGHPNLPAGEFSGGHFKSPYSKTSATEKVSLLKNGNQWVQAGYRYGAVAATSPVAK